MAGADIAQSRRMSVPQTVQASQHRPGALTRNRRPAPPSEVVDTPTRTRAWNSVVAVLFLVVAMLAGYTAIGPPPVIIVGGSGLVAFVIWQRSYLRRPVDPSAILPLFLLTVAALDLHMAEEYLARFGPAMSRLFDISWTERSFLLIFAFVGPCLYALTAIGPLLPDSARRLPRLVHLHRARSSGVHALHLSAAEARTRSDDAGGDHGDGGKRTRRRRDAELLDWRNRPLLLSRSVHRGAADDSRHLRDRSTRRSEDIMRVMSASCVS